jgi:hypothetical protein
MVFNFSEVRVEKLNYGINLMLEIEKVGLR